MRAWTRTIHGRLMCGRCKAVMAAGTPMQTITLQGVKRQLVRCPACAEGDVPPDLPPLMARSQPAPVAMASVRSVMAEVIPLLDWRAKAAGEQP